MYVFDAFNLFWKRLSEENEEILIGVVAENHGCLNEAGKISIMNSYTFPLKDSIMMTIAQIGNRHETVKSEIFSDMNFIF